MIEKELALERTLSSLGSVVVAYSGGIDSAYLACVAHRTLGDAPGRHRRQPELSRAPSEHRGSDCPAASASATRSSGPTSSSGPNTVRIRPTAATTASTSSTRTSHASPSAATPSSSTATMPTIAATIGPAGRPRSEFGVRSPLDEVNLAKDEIRELSRRAGLTNWNEPASACLSSRIPYHTEVTDEKLRTIERAEGALRDAGVPDLSRAPPRRSRPGRDRRGTRWPAPWSRRSALPSCAS